MHDYVLCAVLLPIVVFALRASAPQFARSALKVWPSAYGTPSPWISALRDVCNGSTLSMHSFEFGFFTFARFSFTDTAHLGGPQWRDYGK